MWENAVKRSRDGIVRDPNTNEILTWDKFKQRRGQWDMGPLLSEECVNNLVLLS